MPLISLNSSRWETLSIMSYTKPWDPNRIVSGLVMTNMSSKYLFKSPRALISKIDTGIRPNFQSKGHSVRQKSHTHTPTCKTCELGISVHAYPNGDIWIWLHTGVLGIHEIRMWLHPYHLGISQCIFNRGYAFKCIYLAFSISCGECAKGDIPSWQCVHVSLGRIRCVSPIYTFYKRTHPHTPPHTPTYTPPPHTHKGSSGKWVFFFSQKRGFFQKVQQNVFCHKLGWTFAKSFVFFEQTCRLFLSKKIKKKTLRSLCDKFVTFDQKLKTYGIFGWDDRTNFLQFLYWTESSPLSFKVRVYKWL